MDTQRIDRQIGRQRRDEERRISEERKIRLEKMEVVERKESGSLEEAYRQASGEGRIIIEGPNQITEN